MKTTYLLTPGQTVAEVVRRYPETLSAWTALKTGCFGCQLMQFCSLEYVAESYKMKLEGLLDELEKTIRV